MFVHVSQGAEGRQLRQPRQAARQKNNSKIKKNEYKAIRQKREQKPLAPTALPDHPLALTSIRVFSRRARRVGGWTPSPGGETEK